MYLGSLLYIASQTVFTLKASIERLKLPNSKEGIYIAQLVIPLCLMLASWLIFMPIVMKKFTIITSIEMMKDSDLIELVIAE